MFVSKREFWLEWFLELAFSQMKPLCRGERSVVEPYVTHVMFDLLALSTHMSHKSVEKKCSLLVLVFSREPSSRSGPQSCM